MDIRVGQQLVSAVDETMVVVVRWQGEGQALSCGGLEMIDASEASAPKQVSDPEHMNGTQLGKRYADEAGTIELLCTRAGVASLAMDGVALVQKGAKALPASD